MLMPASAWWERTITAPHHHRSEHHHHHGGRRVLSAADHGLRLLLAAWAQAVWACQARALAHALAHALACSHALACLPFPSQRCNAPDAAGVTCVDAPQAFFVPIFAMMGTAMAMAGASNVQASCPRRTRVCHTQARLPAISSDPACHQA